MPFRKMPGASEVVDITGGINVTQKGETISFARNFAKVWGWVGFVNTHYL